MQPQGRMSPMTAFFLGLFGVGAISVAAGAVIVLFGLRMADSHVGGLIRLVDSAVTNLPAIVEGLPPALKEALHDRRAPEYAKNIETQVDMVAGRWSDSPVPTVIIRNQGDELVSLLTIRVAALDEKGRAIREWTTVAATPIGIADEWRGPLMPGATRHVVLDGGCFRGDDDRSAASMVVEIADVRVWTPLPVEMHASASLP